MPMKYPAHPGRLIRSNMKALGMEVPETSLKLNITPESLAQVLNGKSRVTLEMAVELGKLFGNGTDIWRRLQAVYDEAQERNAHEVHLEPQEPFVNQQKATVPLEHGRVIYETFDAEVIALYVVPSGNSELSEEPNHDRVEYRFVGEGPGAVRIQMIYQPSADTKPRLVAEVLFKAYLVWNAEADEYVGHIDASEWNRETDKLVRGKEAMNELLAGLGKPDSSPVMESENPDEINSDSYARVLKEAETLLGSADIPVRAEVLAGV